MRRDKDGWRSQRRARESVARAPREHQPQEFPGHQTRRPDGPAAAAPETGSAPRIQRRRGRLAAAADHDAKPEQTTAGLPSISVASTWPWKGAWWTLTFAAFLVYIYVITTYRLPLGNAAMVTALVGIPFLGAALRFPAALWWMVAFLVWGVLGMIQSPYPWLVEPELITFGKLCLVALVAVNVLRTRANIRLYAVLFLGCYALYPTRGAIFNYVGGYTVFGRAIWNHIYSNPNDLAALTLLQLSLAVSLLPIERHKWTRYCVLAGCVLLPILILMTQSRGAFLALAFFAAFYLAGQRRRARALVVMSALAVLVVMIAPSGVWKRVKGLSNISQVDEGKTKVDEEGSAFQRYEIWRVARAIIRDHPAFGVGFGAYPQAHSEYVAGGGFNRFARGKRDTHSTYLNVTAETGYIGLAIFLAMVGSALVTAERVRRRWRHLFPDTAQQLYALELGLVAFMIAGTFGSFAKLSFLYLHVALMVALARWFDETAAAAVAGGRVPRGARSAPRARATVAAATSIAPGAAVAPRAAGA
jgi:O-antigen ligase